MIDWNFGPWLTVADVWFHRYENERDIEGRCMLVLLD